jgi:hypothetical protein
VFRSTTSWLTDIWPIARILKHHLAVSLAHFDQQLFGHLTHYQIFNTLSDSEFHVFWSKTIWPTDIWPIARILKHHLAVSSTHFDQQLFGRLTHYKIFNTLSDSKFHVFCSKTICPTDIWPIARFLKL